MGREAPDSGPGVGRTGMIDVRHFTASETLKNGSVATIRAVRPDDKPRVKAAFSQLTAESIFRRFFQAKQTLSERELQAATEVDFENVVALVATVPGTDGEIIIGGGRYLVMDRATSPVRAEVAFAVGDGFQGLGLAGRILGHLARIARARGVGEFVAEVLPQNHAMLAVFTRTGWPMSRTMTGSVVHVALSLEPPAEASPAGLGQIPPGHE